MHPGQHAKFQKKIISQFREKLQADGRMDGRTDTPYFLGPFPTRTGVQKIPSQNRTACKY